MNSSKFVNIWKLMDEYTFKTEYTNTSFNLKCLLCKKFMIDACQTSCGCQFCYKCISEYVSSGDKYCPGGNEECHDEYLLIGNIMKCKHLNNMIARLNVKCPNEWCQFHMEISQVEEHLVVCSVQASQCPYTSIGCNKAQGHSYDSFIHTPLMIDWMKKMVADFNEKYDSDHTKLELLTRKLATFEPIKEQLLAKKKLETKIATLDNELKIVDRDFKVLQSVSKDREKDISTLKEQCKMMMNIIVKLLEDSKKKEIIFTALEVTQKQIISDISSIKEQIENHKMDQIIHTGDNSNINSLSEQIDNLQEQISTLESNIDTYNTDIDKKIQCYMKDKELCSNIVADFVWRIKDLSNKMSNSFINKTNKNFSKPFYSNGYKFCLGFFINQRIIGLHCYIMKGDNDDTLSWPMTKTVTLSILNQKTFTAQTSANYQYNSYEDKYRTAFSKPKLNRNNVWIGQLSLFYNSNFGEINSTIVNDSLVVSCLTNDVRDNITQYEMENDLESTDASSEMSSVHSYL